MKLLIILALPCVLVLVCLAMSQASLESQLSFTENAKDGEAAKTLVLSHSRGCSSWVRWRHVRRCKKKRSPRSLRKVGKPERPELFILIIPQFSFFCAKFEKS